MRYAVYLRLFADEHVMLAVSRSDRCVYIARGRMSESISHPSRILPSKHERVLRYLRVPSTQIRVRIVRRAAVLVVGKGEMKTVAPKFNCSAA